MSQKYDSIVIGAGTNGLTAACYLAKAGRKVLVIEKRNVIGGMAAGEEFHSGFKSPGLLHDTTELRRGVVDALGLEKHGLKFHSQVLPVFLPSRDASKGGLLLHHDPKEAREEISKWSEKDAKAYDQYRSFFKRTRPFIEKVFDAPTPDLVSMGFPGIWELTKKAVSLRMMGKTDMYELLRIGPMCVADWLGEWFESDLLKAGLCGPSVYGTWTGPWSPSSNANLLISESLKNNDVVGGPAALVQSLKSAADSLGVEFKLSSRVKRINITTGKANGVTLEGDESIDCGKIFASCDAKQLFLEMVHAKELSHQFSHRMEKFRARGTTAKVNLAIKGKLEFDCRKGTSFSRVRTGEHVDEIEQAFDAVKYRQFSKKPSLDIYIPSEGASDYAPDGHSSVSVLVNYAPYDLDGGWNDGARSELEKTVISSLSEYVPGLSDQIVGAETLSPADIEARYGTTAGHIHHGEHAPDQLLVRPVPECSGYGSPVEGLFPCGSSAHPGGGVTCAPGALASRVIG